MTDKPSTDECLQVLGLKRGATPEDYRRAYRDLVEVWHPDRLAYNERLQLLANEHLKKINEAYAYLMERWRSSRPSISLSVANTRPRVLCVDDDILVLKGFRRLLSQRFEVITATDAQAALDILLGDEEVAVVLSDLMMPRVDGVAFLRQALIVSPHSTRILVTGYKEAVDMAVALDRRLLFRILDKSCGEEVLFEAVRQGVDEWRARTANATKGQ